MRKAIETLKNIWKIEDLRQRILITILFVAIYRFGSYVVLPGINPAMLAKLHEQTSEGLLALLNMFSGGAFSNASIFALGIMPYISASIVIQLLGIAVPYFQKLQREGESGRRKMNPSLECQRLQAIGKPYAFLSHHRNLPYYECTRFLSYQHLLIVIFLSQRTQRLMRNVAQTVGFAL